MDMHDASDLDDLGLAAVHTPEDLAARLRTIRILADKPSLRTLETKTKHDRTPLSKTTVAEMLKGVRFPRKAVMLSFLRACGVPEDAMEPWLRAWQRIASNAQKLAGPGAPLATAAGPRDPGPANLQPLPGALPNQNTPGDRPLAAEQSQTGQLQSQVSQLLAENEQLRLQLAGETDSFLQPATVRDPSANDYLASQGQAVRYFSIDNERSEQLFYKELEEYIKNAKEEVYVVGKGFYDEQRSLIYESLLRAEKEALRHRVDMMRIQTGSPVAPSWAEGYAQLLEDFPDNFRMRADLDGVSYNDVILIDPHGRDPIVSFLFETREQRRLGYVGRPVLALFITNARALASNLADQLFDRANDLAKLDSQVVRDLATKYTYFAWGVHMANSKIQRDVPDARHLGKAILRSWRRDIKGMLSGPADRATIQFTDNEEDAFDGVAYELSWWGKARIDRLELRAYEEVSVDIEHNGRTRTAFTYIPLPAANEKDTLSVGSWIALVVEGARENQMTGLLAELRDGGAPIDDIRI
jgi:hypothetical protein